MRKDKLESVSLNLDRPTKKVRLNAGQYADYKCFLCNVGIGESEIFRCAESFDRRGENCKKFKMGKFAGIYKHIDSHLHPMSGYHLNFLICCNSNQFDLD